jgi:hypothetical protein
MKTLISEVLNQYIFETQKKWTKEVVHKIALDYDNLSDFIKNAKNAYGASKKYGWFEEISSHMKTSSIKWTKEMIASEAKKYKTKEGFRKGSPKAHDRAYSWGIMDEITQHMVPLGDLFNRLVYAYEFPDNTAYIGLTHDKDERDYLHRIKGPIAKHINETGLQPVLKLISVDYINAVDAQNLEACTIEKYKKDGWNLLNKAKAGSLGMCKVFWTKDKVQNEANKFERRVDFQKNSPKAYNAALRNGWLDEVCDHMEKTFIEWTKDKVIEIAKEYTKVIDFQRNSPKAYGAAQRNGWLSEITKGMERQHDWTEENIITEMSKYNSLNEFRKHSNSAYVTTVDRFGSKFIHDFYGTTPKIMWTPELLKKESSKYKTRLEFQRGSASAYRAAQRMGVLDDIVKDMEPDFMWTEDKVREEAKKYDTRMEFKKGSKTAYKYALKWGILDELIPSLRPSKDNDL